VVFVFPFSTTKGQKIKEIEDMKKRKEKNFFFLCVKKKKE
jgi:hypothetical protein